MADVVLSYGSRTGPWRPSDPLVIVPTDSTLVNFDGTPEVSDHADLQQSGMVTLYVDVTPEAAQAVVVQVETSPDNTSDDWYAEWDGDATGVGKREYVFSTTGLYALSFDGADLWMRLQYGYRGGTGASADLTLTLVGRRDA